MVVMVMEVMTFDEKQEEGVVETYSLVMDVGEEMGKMMEEDSSAVVVLVVVAAAPVDVMDTLHLPLVERHTLLLLPLVVGTVGDSSFVVVVDLRTHHRKMDSSSSAVVVDGVDAAEGPWDTVLAVMTMMEMMTVVVEPARSPLSTCLGTNDNKRGPSGTKTN